MCPWRTISDSRLQSAFKDGKGKGARTQGVAERTAGVEARIVNDRLIPLGFNPISEPLNNSSITLQHFADSFLTIVVIRW